MTGGDYIRCECKGQLCEHRRRCLKKATVELRQSKRRGKPVPGPWFHYCEDCADEIESSGTTNPLDRREFRNE